MKIIITMAGRGSRFQKLGINKPKHEIIVKDKTLFEYSMLSLSDFFDEQFLFIVRKDNYNKNNMQKLCSNIGIYNFKIIEIDEMTDGQARTVLFANSYVGEHEDFAIYNIDTAIEPGIIKKSYLNGYEGYIPTFHAEGSHWSFIKVKDDCVTEVAEKVRISDLAVLGFYYFSDWKKYCDIISEHDEEIKKTAKELYVAPMYQYLIDSGEKVGFQIIDENKVMPLGTPEEITAVDPQYFERNIL